MRVRVSPNAVRTEAVGEIEDETGNRRLQVRLKAPPVEGKANAALCAWAADLFNTRAGRVSVLRGEKSRKKDLLIEGFEIQKVEAEALIAELLKSTTKKENKKEKDHEDV